MNPEEVAGAFSKLQHSGKVREFGVSNFCPRQLTLLQKACPMPLIVNQVEISLVKLDPFEDGTLDQCIEQNVTPLAWSPLDGGRLGSTAKSTSASPHPVAMELFEAVDAVAEGRGASRTKISLAWLLRHPSKIIPLVGSVNPEHIREAAEAADLELTREEWYRLFEAAKGKRLP
jgi:predicted oxidoreductase